MKKIEYLIIGAGPCGLGAGFRLKELGVENFLLVEKEKYSGGLATSFRDEKGFLWDIGGHVLFSHYPYFDQAVDNALGKEGWYNHQRQAWIWHTNQFIPYPFQNNLHHLSDEQSQKCLSDLKNERLNQNQAPENFKQWLKVNFGEELCHLFMYPYNKKVWGTDLERMSHHWISERVSLISPQMIEEILKEKKDQISWGPNSQFRFPKIGGTGAIWSALSKIVGLDKIKNGFELKSIDLNNKIAHFENESIQYQKILSTIPLKTLYQCLPSFDLPDGRSVENLTHSKTHIIGLGFKGILPKHFSQKCWIYFADHLSPFYRLTVFSNYSPDHTPQGDDYFSLMCEVCDTSTTPQPEPSVLIENCYQYLLQQRLIANEHQLISRWSYTAPFGYPVPTVERDEILKYNLPLLEKNQIYSRGRFGGWKYEVSNQDHTFMQGVEWVNWQIQDVPETTYTY